MEGKGTLINKDKNKYIGEFKNNLRHGKGKYILSDVTTINGIFYKNKCIKKINDF
jgi:hypothetical protein